MLAYLTYMTERLAEMRRLLKRTGSIYLHCDQTASHYLKIVMDGIFGASNFRNEVVWSYRTGGVSKRYWPRKHDVLLFYVKSDAYSTARCRSGCCTTSRSSTRSSTRRAGPTPTCTSATFGTTSSRSSTCRRSGSATRRKSPWRLLERIIEASSNPGDMVLDPFCGCGTTVVAAENLGRRWAGVEISGFAIDLIQERRG